MMLIFERDDKAPTLCSAFSQTGLLVPVGRGTTVLPYGFFLASRNPPCPGIETQVTSIQSQGLQISTMRKRLRLHRPEPSILSKIPDSIGLLTSPCGV